MSYILKPGFPRSPDQWQDPNAGHSESLRVIIRIPLKYIPGEIRARPFMLGRLFCKTRLGRDFDEVCRRDHSTIPPGFDSEEDVKRWFLFDFNVKEVVKRENLRQTVRHECYLGCMRDGELWVPCGGESRSDSADKFITECLFQNRNRTKLCSRTARCTNGVD
jgi:hypothetical protein